MAERDIEQVRLALEKERFDFEKAQASPKKSFFLKHLGAIVTAAVSLAAVLVSATQIYVAHIGQLAQMEAARIQKERELEVTHLQYKGNLILSKEKYEVEWKIKAAELVLDKYDDIFSKDKETQERIQRVLLASFPPEINESLFKRLSNVAANEVWDEGLQKVREMKSENMLLLRMRSLKLIRSHDFWFTKNEIAVIFITLTEKTWETSADKIIPKISISKCSNVKSGDQVTFGDSGFIFYEGYPGGFMQYHIVVAELDDSSSFSKRKIMDIVRSNMKSIPKGESSILSGDAILELTSSAILSYLDKRGDDLLFLYRDTMVEGIDILSRTNIIGNNHVSANINIDWVPISQSVENQQVNKVGEERR